MVKDIHKVLSKGVRSTNKVRGEFRKIQNWIGPAGSTIETATYMPPAPGLIIKYLSDWENFVNSDYIDLLIQFGLIHAQFEIIHPFLDGNGRLGRILIPIFLYQYFEINRDEYYSTLNGITHNGDWQSWIEFFLKDVIVQSETNIVKIKEIMDLYEEMKFKIS